MKENFSLNDKIEHAKELIREVLKKHGRDNIKVACSWGKDSMVMLHIALQVDPKIPVFTVLTRFKPQETFEYMDHIKEEWKLDQLEVFINNDDEVPVNLHKTDPDECCRILKVVPTLNAIKDAECWLTGLRNTEGRTRVDYHEVEEEIGFPVKVNPILTFTEREIWQYMATREIPVHPWYAKGYRSLGCSPCTHIVGENESERDGRWKDTSKCGGECGIHTFHKKKEMQVLM